MNTPSLKALAQVVLGAALTLVLADLGIQRIAPVAPRIIEVADGIAAYQAGDPDTLVLGSSHTRSFAPVAETLARESGGQIQAVLVPVEWGTFSSYNWVLRHRLKDLIEERRGDGQLRRPRLQRALLIATFYDLCAKSYVGLTANLPARAWAIEHFLLDTVENGLTPYNRNYLQTQWKLLFDHSILVTDRGYQRAPYALISQVRPLPPPEVLRARRIQMARGHMEEQYDHCDDDAEKRELLQMINYFHGRDIELSIINFPLDPAIITEKSRQTTLARYDRFSAQLAREQPIRLVDLTFKTPLMDLDFQADLDHVTPESNKKFAAWALANDLAYLRTPRVRTATPGARP